MASQPLPPEPITLEDAKNNLRVDIIDDDARIQALIVVARTLVEKETGLILKPRQITETEPRLSRWIDLNIWPVNEIIEIRRTLRDGTMVVIPSTEYRFNLKRRPVRIAPIHLDWGLAGGGWFWEGPFRHEHHHPDLPVEIDLDAGYATPADVPETARQAMYLLISHFYTNRSAAEVGTRAAAVEVPFVETLLDACRVELV